MKKYLVICINGEACIGSVDPFDTVEEANLFINTDAALVYSAHKNEDSSSIECCEGFAVVTTAAMTWKWTICPLEIE